MVANLRVEDWHTVHQRLRGIAKRRAALDAEEARCLRDAELIQLWRKLGYAHMGEYLERELGYGPHAGAERLRVARELADLPQIEAALDEGVLHFTAVRELSRIATRDTEAEWLATVRGKNLRQVEAAVAGRKRGDRPGDPTTPELVNRIVRLELSPSVFALFRQAQAALADEHGGRLDDNAFVHALCRCALERSASGDQARPAHQISITVCQSCKRGWQNGAGREVEVGPEVIERAQCDAEQLGSLDAAQPARVTSTLTPRSRRQVFARDHHACTVPGCRSARHLDVHHIEYQRDGGGHVTILCSAHHLRLHEGALTIRGRAPDALEFIWRTGDAPSEIEQAGGRGGTAPAPQPPTGGVAKDVNQPASDVGSETHRHTPNPVPATAIQPHSSHVGPETHRHTPNHVPATAIQPHSSHVGPETHRHTPTAAASSNLQPGTSHVGPEPHRHTPTAAASSNLQPGTPHVGPEPHRHTPTAAASSNLQPGTSHVGPETHRHTPATEVPSNRQSRTSHVGPEINLIAREARSALTTAGYRPHEAARAVEQARGQVAPGATLEQLLRAALRCCGTRSQG